MLAVKEQNPELDIRFVFQRNNTLSKNSKTTYGAWCEKHGFPYCIFPNIPRIGSNDQLANHPLAVELDQWFKAGKKGVPFRRSLPCSRVPRGLGRCRRLLMTETTSSAKDHAPTALHQMLTLCTLMAVVTASAVAITLGAVPMKHNCHVKTSPE